MHALPAYLVFVLKVQSKMNERKSNKQKFQNPAKSHISFSKQSAKSQVNIQASTTIYAKARPVNHLPLLRKCLVPLFFRLRHHTQKVNNSTQHRESAH